MKITTGNEIKAFATLLTAIIWFTGIVSVKGFWWTLLTIIPPFGFYFGVETFLKYFGVL